MNPTLQAFKPSDRAIGAFRPNRPDFSPVAPKAMSQAPAEAALERAFRPANPELVSFLVNGLYLIGSHRILEWDSRDAGIAEDLEALGHRVTAASASSLAPPLDLAAGSFDRAMLVSRAFGYGGDEADRLWLKTMHQALQPGGLLLFHVLDRDRAWSLVRDFPGQAGQGAAGTKADAAFDPASGKVTARIRPGHVEGGGPSPAGRPVSVRAFNLGELRALLAATGFTLERAYGDWQGGGLEEAGERTGRILAVASKNRRMNRKTRSGAGRRGAP